MTSIASERARKRLSYHHEGGVLFAEDIGQHMAVLPELDVRPDEVKIDDIQVGEPRCTIDEGARRLIWKKRHLLIGKGNIPPPAARGAICNIDVVKAAPIAQRVRPVDPKFREKLAELIKGFFWLKSYVPQLHRGRRRS